MKEKNEMLGDAWHQRELIFQAEGESCERLIERI